MNLTDVNGDPFQENLCKICMTQLLRDDHPYINAIVQIDIDDGYHFVCKNEHEC